MSRLLILMLRGYQRFVSPFLPPACRYHPTCSQYAIEAIRGHGPLRGGWLAIKRLMRCHPWGRGGLDPLPPPDPKPQPSTPGRDR